MKRTITLVPFFLLLFTQIYTISLKGQPMFNQNLTLTEQAEMYEVSESILPNSAFLFESSFWDNNSLTIQDHKNSLFGLNFSNEISKNIYSHSIPLLLFATATRGNTQAFSLEKKTIAGYEPAYVTGSSMHWFVGEQLFAVDNSAFFGIEFNTFFFYNSGVIRIGDSSEKAFVILVSLIPANRFRRW